jgi:large subunit ribosomal protein L4
LYKGGARAFGPRPRDYSFKLNKKVKALARRSALSQKAAGSQITVLEDFTFEAPKTSAFARFLNGFEASNQRVLVVTSEKNEALVLSSRNLQKARVVRAEDLNTYDLMKASRLLLMSSSVGKISQQLNP